MGNIILPLEVKNITKCLDKDKQSSFTLKIEEFVIERGDIFAILGPNGSGKTTLIKLILNLLFPDSGIIKIFGINSKLSKSRKNLSYLPEEFSFPNDYAVKNAAYYFGLMNKLSSNEVKNDIKIISDEFQFTNILNKKVSKLSKGMYQNLGILNSLIGFKDFLILDEPFNSLDPLQRKIVMEYLLKLNVEHSTTILYCSHILSDVEIFSNHIALIKNGIIISNNSIKDVLKDYGSVDKHYFSYFKVKPDN